jgi:hypothetical protein
MIDYRFFNGSTPGDLVVLFTRAGLKNVSINNLKTILKKLREFENKNTSFSYKVANNPISLHGARGKVKLSRCCDFPLQFNHFVPFMCRISSSGSEQMRDDTSHTLLNPDRI